jgi:hypothetical protein
MRYGNLSRKDANAQSKLYAWLEKFMYGVF